MTRGSSRWTAGRPTRTPPIGSSSSGSAGRPKNPEKLSLIDEYFSYEPYGFMLRRNDSAFRLSVNRALARVYRSGDVVPIVNKWFGSIGAPGRLLGAMYLINALPE